MRAIAFESYGPAEVLRAVDLPLPEPAPGTVRIRVEFAAVNPADHKWRTGMFRELVPLTLPHVLGYDVSGTIDALGADVAGPSVGTRVAAMLDPITKGGYAEFAIARIESVARVPDALDLAVAATVPTAGLTGAQGIEEHLRPARGERVLVTGAVGAVGRFAVVAARRQGAQVVAAVRQTQIEAARAAGADEVVVLGAPVAPDLALHHAFDTVGGADVAALCRRVASKGRIITVSTTPIDPAGLPSAPVFIGVRPDGARLAALLEDAAAGAVAVPIARRLPLREAAEAQRLVERGGLAGKVVLVV